MTPEALIITLLVALVFGATHSHSHTRSRHR